MHEILRFPAVVRPGPEIPALPDVETARRGVYFRRALVGGRPVASVVGADGDEHVTIYVPDGLRSDQVQALLELAWDMLDVIEPPGPRGLQS